MGVLTKDGLIRRKKTEGNDDNTLIVCGKDGPNQDVNSMVGIAPVVGERRKLQNLKLEACLDMVQSLWSQAQA